MLKGVKKVLANPEIKLKLQQLPQMKKDLEEQSELYNQASRLEREANKKRQEEEYKLEEEQ